MTAVRVVLVTAPDAAFAESAARRLVDERLCACVSLLGGVTSIYRWQGAVEQASEVMMVIKTTQDRVPALVDRISGIHPYKVPEVLVLAVENGLPAYLAWVVDETARVTV